MQNITSDMVIEMVPNLPLDHEPPPQVGAEDHEFSPRSASEPLLHAKAAARDPIAAILERKFSTSKPGTVASMSVEAEALVPMLPVKGAAAMLSSQMPVKPVGVRRESAGVVSWVAALKDIEETKDRFFRRTMGKTKWCSKLEFDLLSSRYALQLAIGITIASLFFLYKEHLIGTGGAWVAITVVVVVEFNLGSSLIKSIQRSLGTLLGGAAGLGIIALVGYTGPDCFVCDYKIAVILSLIFIVALVFAYFRAALPKYSYLYTLACLSMMIVLDGAMNGSNPSDTLRFITVYWTRMAAVLIGIGIGFLVTVLVFPNRASVRLRDKLSSIVRVDLVEAFEVVLSTLVEESLIKAATIETPVHHTNEEELLRAFSAPTLRTPEFAHNKRLMLVHSSENLERALARISNKIGECRDILKVADGEPILRGWRVEWLPLEEYKQVILKVRALFNLAIPLIYLVRLETESPVQVEYDMLLDFYHMELVSVRDKLSKVLLVIADYLQTGDDKERAEAFDAIEQFALAVHAVDRKHDLLSKQEWKFPATEVQALHQVRLCMHFMVSKTQRLIEAIDNVGWRRGRYYKVTRVALSHQSE